VKRLYILAAILVASLTAEGHHIIGGEMSYAFVSSDGNNYTYDITLKLYRGCEPVDGNHDALDDTTAFSVFSNDNHKLFTIMDSIPLDGPHFPDRQRNDPCIITPPTICYQIGYYKARVTLPVNKTGYTIAWQRSSRSDQIINVDTKGSVGASYFTIVPGTDNGIPGDNGPVFSKEEAVLICSEGPVDYSCAATDADGDKLTYSFHTTYVGGSGAVIMPVPCAPPPYKPITYVQAFSATEPLGPGVTINPETGEIHGRTNLEAGTYDICVAVQAHRGGKVIATHLKDLQFEVHDCHRVVLADIPPLFNDCRSFKINFDDNSTPGKSYLWDFGDGDTSTAYQPVHQYRDTGVYHVWLKVDPQSPCGDSIETEARVFPGLKTSFSYQGNCAGFPVAFRDASATPFGRITSRRWDFGGGDTSLSNQPAFQFADTGLYRVALTVTTDKGCLQSDTQSVRLYDTLQVRIMADTAICPGDRIQLRAAGGAFYHWSPAATLSDPAVRAPWVSPSASTRYSVQVTDTTGCSRPSSASVLVAVLPPVRASAGDDTTAVLGMPFRLQATGGNVYTWSPPTGLSDPSVADPVVEGTGAMTYRVRVAREPEGCFAYDTVQVSFMKGPTLYAPTAFTPNGDGRNDLFRPFPVGLAQLDYFQVYDRWGKLVFRTRAFRQGWDGTLNGRPAPAGAYVWMAAGQDKEGQMISRRGSVLLIR
jgi:gliding motility-associated-like protein